VFGDERRVYEKRISLGTLIRAEMKGVWFKVIELDGTAVDRLNSRV
jgi:hypothetical protein